jgi:sigma-B regulation protein RsbU (phosphoserine phosphatase)
VQGKEGFVHGTDFATGKQAWLYYAPVPSSGWSLGVVFPEDELFAEVVGLLRRNVLIALVGLIFLAATITAVSRTITRPLRGLARKTADIAQGDFTATVPETGAKEVAHLARSFNRMGQQLTEYIEKRDFIRDTFGRYLTQEVVKKLLESRGALEMGGETREVSILMSDLRGFTALTAEMHPEEVITFLNRYLGKMIEILMDYRATIDEIIGDGILAFFGAPEELADHPARAVACALKMQTAMEEINALNAADGLPHLEMGIAVNTGEVVVGNIGSEKRTKYSVVGSQVNFVSRLESYAVGGQVLISPATFARVEDLVEVGKTLQAEMKGVRGTTTVYEVRGIRGPYEVHLTAKSETLMPLPQRLDAHLFHIADKIVTGAPEPCVITHLGESAAVLACQGELSLWEDVRLVLLDERLAEMPGKIYGKVTAIKPAGDQLQEAHLHFTSVSPELYRLIQQAAGEGTGKPPGDEVGET